MKPSWWDEEQDADLILDKVYSHSVQNGWIINIRTLLNLGTAWNF